MRARRRSRLAAGAAVAVATALAVAPAAAPANDAGSITHAAGAVTATLTWAEGEGLGITAPRLSVVRNGTTYDLKLTDICREGCVLAADDADDDPTGATSMLKVADLDGDGEPEVIADVYSGGAHCCLTARVETWDGAGYRRKDIAYGDVGYVVRDADGDGRPELVGQSPLFAYAFTAFADSAFPVQVLQVSHGKVADVTRRFPKLVRADAAKLRRALRTARRGADVRGVLAAYVADEYLLGHAVAAKAEIAHQHRLGRTSAAFGPQLLRRLHAWGYR